MKTIETILLRSWFDEAFVVHSLHTWTPVVNVCVNCFFWLIRSKATATAPSPSSSPTSAATTSTATSTANATTALVLLLASLVLGLRCVVNQKRVEWEGVGKDVVADLAAADADVVE